MDVTVAVGTFGGLGWLRLAKARAIPSAEALGVPVVHAHADTLHDARNEALAKVSTEFVIHLDADDTLEPGYTDAMAKGTADLRVPRLRQVRRKRVGSPFYPQVWGHTHRCEAPCLRGGNFIVIGACVRTDLVRQVGGWEPWGWSEDWAMFARCWKAGATIEWCPDAIYRAWVSPGSRNRCLTNAQTVDWHRQIEAAVWGDQAA